MRLRSEKDLRADVEDSPSLLGSVRLGRSPGPGSCTRELPVHAPVSDNALRQAHTIRTWRASFECKRQIVVTYIALHVNRREARYDHCHNGRCVSRSSTHVGLLWSVKQTT